MGIPLREPQKMAGSKRGATESKNEDPNHTVFEGTGYLFEAGTFTSARRVSPLRSSIVLSTPPVAAGNKLRLPDEAICSACVMFHTFFETETSREYCLHVSLKLTYASNSEVRKALCSYVKTYTH